VELLIQDALCTDILLDKYVRVEVLSISPNHLDYDVYIPARDCEMVLGKLVGYFIAWQRQDIIVLTNPSTTYVSATIDSSRGTRRNRTHG